MQEEKIYPVPARVLVPIANYLKKRPWEETNEFIYALLRICQPIDEAEERALRMANKQMPLPPGAGGDAELPPSPPNGSGRTRRERRRDASDTPSDKDQT